MLTFIYTLKKSCDSKQEPKRITYLDENILYNYAISKFLPISEFKWIDLKEFDSNKYSSNNSKELHEIYNDYSLTKDKTEIKKRIAV